MKSIGRRLSHPPSWHSAVLVVCLLVVCLNSYTTLHHIALEGSSSSSGPGAYGDMPSATRGASPYGYFVNDGPATALPSVRISESEEVDRKFYGGKGDKPHLGGFTSFDPNGGHLDELVRAARAGVRGVRGGEPRRDGTEPHPDDTGGQGAGGYGGGDDRARLLEGALVAEEDGRRGVSSEREDLRGFDKLGRQGGIFVSRLEFSLVSLVCLAKVVRGVHGARRQEFPAQLPDRVSEGGNNLHDALALGRQARQISMEDKNRRDLVADMAKYSEEQKLTFNVGQHLWGTLLVFLNPLVLSRHEHAHLYSEHGCNHPQRGREQECGKPGGGDGVEVNTALPPEYKAIPITKEMDDNWLDLIRDIPLP
ncbi:hypothetical protein THAOC_06415 [Thalassiosira oceanica]|uniref:Uncharacterized protein n=1 Tax=Thalassiosira oceanica TaxID=159749 RepID=K0TLS1_THAOC|nr:hypothetical protein THAOC_06415 [Thalassiosira oceanica]|eukprot:EJK72092.1 hypothetical protein THAOC_06415 [Thalassiosira oceanica]